MFSISQSYLGWNTLPAHFMASMSAGTSGQKHLPVFFVSGLKNLHSMHFAIIFSYPFTIIFLWKS